MTADRFTDIAIDIYADVQNNQFGVAVLMIAARLRALSNSNSPACTTHAEGEVPGAAEPSPIPQPRRGELIHGEMQCP